MSSFVASTPHQNGGGDELDAAEPRSGPRGRIGCEHAAGFAILACERTGGEGRAGSEAPDTARLIGRISAPIEAGMLPFDAAIHCFLPLNLGQRKFPWTAPLN